MKLNRENFINNELFQELIEMGDIFLDDCPADCTIFILEDGTVINALSSCGVRMTDHHAILQEDDWVIERLITVEPETHNIILPTNPTIEQLDSIEAINNLWNDLQVIEL